ncbi:hypothetical protein [Ammoniphilus sp. CFH 90114]|uniref:hypothetical protein n=1 Tax=Ammoniphilus sp. CFH 90114 TaxID=2493665 RepID=UPI00100E01B3|nr:hypothetical protein [Ammoniphilus sp. CFH 90114]RXT14927.1 hypothetical protein EIZ39_01585 [Ammoniphilus sp. CFH 90114]
MKSWISFASLILCTITILGCQSQESVHNQTVEKNVSTEAAEKPLETEAEKTKTLFLDKLRPEMSEAEVRSLFGGDFSLVENAMEGNETWRYDLGKKSTYQFDDQGIDKVDLEGLKAGEVEALLFVDWTEDGVVNSAALYINDPLEVGTFYEYHIDPDGTVEEVVKTLD